MRTGTLRFLTAVMVSGLLGTNTSWAADPAPAGKLPEIEKKEAAAPPRVAEMEGEEANSSGRTPGLFATADYLLMRPRRQYLDFAIQDVTVSNDRPDGIVSSMKWELSSGFRAGFGYRFESGWDVASSFTYLFTNDNRGLAAPPGGTLLATLTHPRSAEEVSTARAESDFHYHVLDVEAGRRWQIEESLSLRFTAGTRWAWINQKVTSIYDGMFATGDRVFNRINFTGGGLRVGGEGRWHMGWGMSFFGRAGLGLLVGHFEVDLFETQFFGTTTEVNVIDRFEKVVPVTDLTVGLSWERGNWRFSVGYEMATWFELVDTPDFADDIHVGKMARRVSNVSLDGVVFQLAVGY